MDAAKSYGNKLLSGQAPTYDTSKGVFQNVQQHLGNIKAKGDQSISEAYNYNALQNAADPGRGIRQFQKLLSGARKPIVHNPLDRFIAGEWQ